MINLTEVLRLLAEGIANEIMSSQAKDFEAADTNAPAATYFGTAHEHAEKITQLVLVDHPITPRKTA